MLATVLTYIKTIDTRTQITAIWIVTCKTQNSNSGHNPLTFQLPNVRELKTIKYAYVKET